MGQRDGVPIWEWRAGNGTLLFDKGCAGSPDVNPNRIFALNGPTLCR
jgi:hypothetical protein